MYGTNGFVANVNNSTWMGKVRRINVSMDEEKQFSKIDCHKLQSCVCEERNHQNGKRAAKINSSSHSSSSIDILHFEYVLVADSFLGAFLLNIKQYIYKFEFHIFFLVHITKWLSDHRTLRLLLFTRSTYFLNSSLIAERTTRHFTHWCPVIISIYFITLVRRFVSDLDFFFFFISSTFRYFFRKLKNEKKIRLQIKSVFFYSIIRLYFRWFGFFFWGIECWFLLCSRQFDFEWNRLILLDWRIDISFRFESLSSMRW